MKMCPGVQGVLSMLVHMSAEDTCSDLLEALENSFTFTVVLIKQLSRHVISCCGRGLAEPRSHHSAVEVQYEIPRPPTPLAILHTSIDMDNDDYDDEDPERGSNKSAEIWIFEKSDLQPPPYSFALEDSVIQHQLPGYYSFLNSCK